VDGFAQALDDDYADALDDTSRDYLRRIRAGAQRMGLLIDDLLDLSRVGRAEMTRERVDVTALAHDVVRALRAGDPNRVVDVVIQPGIVADADPGLLRVVLQNLIANAWKFTRDADPARIEVGTSRDGGRATHFVRDNGAGFDMAYAHKLFAPFQRLHPDSQFPGTGVGLATVSRIVARHGGEVSADGRVGEGATFRFTLE
jgi:light-regulated signal transduction histidine kinase (bacteriophytochrome)